MNLAEGELHGAIIRGTTLLDAELTAAKLAKTVIDGADL